jgi:hypothetical protein
MMDIYLPAENPAFSESNACYFFRFGLIVTGEGEREHLPKLFRSLTATDLQLPSDKTYWPAQPNSLN